MAGAAEATSQVVEWVGIAGTGDLRHVMQAKVVDKHKRRHKQDNKEYKHKHRHKQEYKHLRHKHRLRQEY